MNEYFDSLEAIVSEAHLEIATALGECEFANIRDNYLSRRGGKLTTILRLALSVRADRREEFLFCVDDARREVKAALAARESDCRKVYR